MTLGRWNGQGFLPLSRIPYELVPRGQEASLSDSLEVSTAGRKVQPALPVSQGHLGLSTLVRLCLLPFALGHSNP